MYKVLIIDDEKPVHIAIMNLIKWKDLGTEPPVSAFNGKEGLSVMRELRPDIVFVDMQMPLMNGMQFLEIASKEFPASKYIVVSGYDDFSYAHAAIKGGAIEYLLKPLVMEDLNCALQKAVVSLNIQHNIEVNAVSEGIDISPLEIVEEIKDFIEKNYCSDIKIAMFSEKYYVSKEYLSKLFKKKYDCGIYEYALTIRMRRAKDLLADPAIQIQQIAERLGYNNSNYFSKAFRTYYHISPTDFRDIILK